MGSRAPRQGHLGCCSTPAFHTFAAAPPSREARKEERKKFFASTSPAPGSVRTRQGRGSPLLRPRPDERPCPASHPELGSTQQGVIQRAAPSGDPAGASICHYPAKYRVNPVLEWEHARPAPAPPELRATSPNPSPRCPPAALLPLLSRTGSTPHNEGKKNNFFFFLNVI